MAGMWQSLLKPSFIPRLARVGERSFWMHLSKRAFLLSAALLATGCGPVSSTGPAGLAVAFARHAASGQEDLLVGRFTAQGNPQGSMANLGPLGLVAQAQIMTSDGPDLWVTTGHEVVRIKNPAHPRVVLHAPSGTTVLSLAYLWGHLWLAAEGIHSHRVRIYEDAGRLRLRAETPLAITTLVPGPPGSVAVLSASPHHATVTLLLGQNRRTWVVDGVPQGTLAFGKGWGYLPVTHGLRGFGMAQMPARGSQTVRQSTYSSVWHAVIAVVPSSPPYGITVNGLIPLQRGQWNWKGLQAWPRPLQATITSDGTGNGWVLIVDGPSQGYWFNAARGRFGESFTVQAPPGAFPREVVPWPS